jgi:hypothetical protein
MTSCPNCNSDSIIKKGKEFARGVVKQRYKCKSCEVNFYSNEEDQTINLPEPSIECKKFVITTAINDTDTNEEFLENLLKYCKHNNANLIIVPIKYKTDFDDYTWDTNLSPHLVDYNVNITPKLKLMAGINVSPTIANPLAGFDSINKGTSLIIPHPQISMKCVAVNHVDKSAILHTTGTISHPVYSNTKTGHRATLDYSFSALIIEVDDEIDDFHIRVLNADFDGNFYDLNTHYTTDAIYKIDNVAAIVVGDEHIINIDPEIMNTTFTTKNSIVNTLNPTWIVRHDVLDFYSANHHHKNNFLLQYKKFIKNENVVEDELDITIDTIIATTPKDSVSIIVSSNHNDHLGRWLQECNPKLEPWNAKLYHQLMYRMLDNLECGIEDTAFETYYAENYSNPKVRFIKETESFKIHDIELALHSADGINGSRGSAAQFSRLGVKTIIGHSHTPNIVGDCYQVGHSCKDKMSYNKGPSSWHNSHCIIHNDGSRQMLFVKSGKWRL